MPFSMPGYLVIHDAWDISSSSDDNPLGSQLCTLKVWSQYKIWGRHSSSLKDIYQELFSFQRDPLEYMSPLIVVIPTGDLLGGGRWDWGTEKVLTQSSCPLQITSHRSYPTLPIFRVREFNLGDPEQPAIFVRRMFASSRRLSCREADFKLVQGRPFLSVRAKRPWMGMHPWGSGALLVPGNVQILHPAENRAEPHASKLPSGSEVLDSMKEFLPQCYYCSFRSWSHKVKERIFPVDLYRCVSLIKIGMTKWRFLEMLKKKKS